MRTAQGAAAGGLDLRYEPKVRVLHRRGAAYPGRPVELSHDGSSADGAIVLDAEGGDKGAAGVRSKDAQTVFYSRVAALAEAVGNAPEWEGGGVVLVGHGAVCSILVRELTGESLKKVSGGKRSAGQVRHTGCTELVQWEPGGKWEIVGRLHSVEHLPEALRTC